MTDIAVVQANITGDIGGTGMSRFHIVNDGQSGLTDVICNALGSAVWSLYDQCKSQLPNSSSIQVQDVVKVLNSDSGAITAEIAMTTVPPAVNGQASGAYAAGSGARIYWHTSQPIGRRIARGATYLVPLSNNAYTGQGAINAGAITQIQNAANNYLKTVALQSGQFAVVYHRPKKGQTTGGLFAFITVATVGPQPGSLRSRRS